MSPEQMSLRLELFVQDMEQTIAFYVQILGFEVLRREEDYASLRNGTCIFGLGPIAKLPAERGGYFTRSRLSAARGLGVEIVLEVDDVHLTYEHVQLQQAVERRRGVQVLRHEEDIQRVERATSQQSDDI